MAADATKRVIIDISAAGNIGTSIDGILGKFKELASAVEKVKNDFAPILTTLSNVKIDPSFISGIDSLKSLVGLKLPDLSKFVDGLKGIEGLSGKVADLSALAVQVKKFENIKIPALLQFAEGLSRLSKASDQVRPAADVLSNIYTHINKLSGVRFPDLLRFSLGLDKLAASSEKVRPTADIMSGLYTHLNKMSGMTMPDLTKFTKGLDALADKAVQTGQISNILSRLYTSLNKISGMTLPNFTKFTDGLTKLIALNGQVGTADRIMISLSNSIARFKNIEIPAIDKLARGLQSLSKLDIAKVISNLSLLAHAITNLDKTGQLKSFATLATDLRHLTTNLTAALGPLNQIQNGMNGIGRAASEAGEKTRGFGERLVNYLQYRVIADSVMAMQRAFGGSIDVIRDFDQSLKDLQAITSATDTEVSMMSKTIIDVAETTKFSAGQVAEGMKILGQAGFSAAESMQTIRAVSDLATGTLSDMGQTVDLLSTALRVFDIAAINSSHVADVFATAVNKSKLDIEKLRTSFNYVGPVAQEVGVSFEETAASLMLLANTGLRASTIGTSLRSIFSELADPSEKLSNAIAEAGFSISEFDPKTQGLQRVLSKLNIVVKDAGMAFDIFGKRAAGSIMTLKDSGGGFESMLGQLAVSGSAADMAAIQMEGLGVMIKNLKDKVELLAVSLGKAGVNDAMRLLVNIARELVTALDAVINSGFGKLILISSTLILSSITILTILGKLKAAWVALSFVMQTNVVAGASVIATQKTISASMISTGIVLRGIGTLYNAASLAATSFAIANTAVFAALTAGAFYIVATIASFVQLVRSIDDFKKSSSEAVEAVAGFANLQAGLDEYSNKVKKMDSNSEELKNTNIALRTELLKTAEGNDVLSQSAAKAAMSINPFTGEIDKGTEAIKGYRKELSKLIADNTIKAYADSMSNVDSQSSRLNRSMNNVITSAVILGQSFKGVLQASLDFASLDFSMLGKNWSKNNKQLKEEIARTFSANDIAKQLEEGKLKWDDYAAYVADVMTKGKKNATSQEKDLVEAFNTANLQAIATLDLMRKSGKVDLSSTNEEFIDLAKSMKITEDQVKAVIYQLDIARKANSASKSQTDGSLLGKEFENGKKEIASFMEEYKKLRISMGAGKLGEEEEKSILAIEGALEKLAKKYVILQQEAEERTRNAKGNNELEVQALEQNLAAQQQFSAELHRLRLDEINSEEALKARKALNVKKEYDEEIRTLTDLLTNESITKEKFNSEWVKSTTKYHSKVRDLLFEVYDPEKFKQAFDRIEEEWKTAISRVDVEIAKRKLAAAQSGDSTSTQIEQVEYTAKVNLDEPLIAKQKELVDNLLTSIQTLEKAGKIKTPEWEATMKQLDNAEQKLNAMTASHIDAQTKVIQTETKLTKESIASAFNKKKANNEIIESERAISLERQKNASLEKIAKLEDQRVDASNIESLTDRAKEEGRINEAILAEKVEQVKREYEEIKKVKIQGEKDIIEVTEKYNSEGNNEIKDAIGNELTYEQNKHQATIAKMMKLEQDLSVLTHQSYSQQITDAKNLSKAVEQTSDAELQRKKDLEASSDRERAINLERSRDESETRLAKMDDRLLTESMGKSALEIARLEMSINKEKSGERIAQITAEISALDDLIDKNQENIDLMKQDSGTDPEHLKYEEEQQTERISKRMKDTRSLYSLTHSLKVQSIEDERKYAAEELKESEYLYRNKLDSAERYHAALKDAQRLNVIDKRQMDREMILSGDDMFAALKLGWKEAAAAAETSMELMARIGSELAERISSGLGDAWVSFIDGSKTAKEAFMDFARSTVSWLLQMITKQLLFNALQMAGKAIGGFADGGEIPKYADGGQIYGSSPHPKADNIHIMATAGEFMHPVAAVRKYGISFMESIRSLRFPTDLSRALTRTSLTAPSSYRLAAGGVVPKDPPVNNFKGGDTKLRVVNVLDKDLLLEALRSPEGETVIANFIRKNGSELSASMGR